MIKLFAERFGEHEMPAPDGAWEAISSQLTLNAAAETDHVNELFRERFAEHTMEVDPGVWSNIGSQLGHGAAAGGWGSIAAWAGSGIAALVLTGAVVWLNHEEPAQPLATQQPTAQTINPTTTGTQEPVTPVIEAPSTQTKPSMTEIFHPIVSNTAPAGNDAGTLPPPQAPSVIPGMVLNEMTTEALEEPLKPETRTEDPRLEEETRPIQLPPYEGHETPASVTPSVSDHSHSPGSTTSTIDEPIVEEPMDATDQQAKPTFSLYLPNVFTPNGDGVNDEYKPEGDGHAQVKIRVYSMTNNQELVFASDENRGWDGTYFNGGRQCPEGMYLYAIEVIDPEGKAHTEGQVVNLLR